MPKTDVQHMSRESLALFVIQLLAILYYDDLEGAYDPDKEWNSDTFEQIGELVREFGLEPVENDTQEQTS